MVGKVALAAVVGNEDSAHKIVADLFQALNDIGFTIGAQGCTYWNGEAMQGKDFNDLDDVPEAVASTTESAARNAVHLAGLLRRYNYPPLHVATRQVGFRCSHPSPVAQYPWDTSTKETVMGDTHTDPTDHSRTHHQHAGESMIDVYFWPGLFLIAVGVVALAGCLAALAYHNTDLLVWAAVTAALTFGGGASWLIVERRRVRRVEARWAAEHPVNQSH